MTVTPETGERLFSLFEGASRLGKKKGLVRMNVNESVIGKKEEREKERQGGRSAKHRSKREQEGGERCVASGQSTK